MHHSSPQMTDIRPNSAQIPHGNYEDRLTNDRNIASHRQTPPQRDACCPPWSYPDRACCFFLKHMFQQNQTHSGSNYTFLDKVLRRRLVSGLVLHSIPFCDNTTIYSSSLLLAGTQGVFRCLPLGSVTMISWYRAFDKILYTFLLVMYLDMIWPNIYCQAVSNVLVQIWTPTVSVSQITNSAASYPHQHSVFSIPLFQPLQQTCGIVMWWFPVCISLITNEGDTFRVYWLFEYLQL